MHGSLDLDGDDGFNMTMTLSPKLNWGLNGGIRQRSTFWLAVAVTRPQSHRKLVANAEGPR